MWIHKYISCFVSRSSLKEHFYPPISPHGLHLRESEGHCHGVNPLTSGWQLVWLLYANLANKKRNFFFLLLCTNFVSDDSFHFNKATLVNGFWGFLVFGFFFNWLNIGLMSNTCLDLAKSCAEQAAKSKKPLM